MQYVKGKFRTNIYDSVSGYKVGLFKVKESCSELEDLINKTITFSGYFTDLNTEDYYIFNGEYTNHPKYGYQFQVSSYKREEPVGRDAVIEFLSSQVIKGCGEKTAIKIVDKLGEQAIDKIKENKDNLLIVPGMSEKRANEIYASIMKYSEADETIIELKKLGFSIKESLKLYKTYGTNIINIIDKNIYDLVTDIDFSLLDKIFLNSNDYNDERRVMASIVDGMKRLSFAIGDIYNKKEDIINFLVNNYNISYDPEKFDNYFIFLKNNNKIIVDDNNYYLKDNFDMENYIASTLIQINNNKKPNPKKIDEILNAVQYEISVKYNNEQIASIKCALENNISIITGGPGTGKTTIVNGLVRSFQKIYDLYGENDLQKIVLLAPTGRASKRMCETTKFPAFTIHRFLKWNKEDNTFGYNEYNPHDPSLIIIDETSMVDTYLLYNLLKGITHKCQIVFVGDENQLPSVGAGLTLSDIINCGVFSHVSLKQIYRQSENSYIPYLAGEIKNRALSDEIYKNKDDFKFIEANNHQIKDIIKQVCERSIQKGLKDSDLEVLVPMYKGENGIDNLNILLQDIFNKSSDLKKEITIGDVTYRENDKVIQLVNDPDNNVYNGDIVYIKKINLKDIKNLIEVNFDGNIVIYKKDDISNIKHAYAISIHKSQGSEFNHVIMPISINYSRMLYNRLIYTGVTRAKKSLIIIGSMNALKMGVDNPYSCNRKTTLKEKIMYNNSK